MITFNSEKGEMYLYECFISHRSLCIFRKRINVILISHYLVTFENMKIRNNDADYEIIVVQKQGCYNEIFT